MGFDVLYLPPIHPIGRTHRKGRNNAVTANPNDPGSPWAIGSAEGGHKSVNPDLGTLDDFRHLVKAARDKGIEVALDIALQCSPDHPYVSQHPEWFRRRPDGSIQYAENPPKKYQDIYPFDYETDAWESLWEEIKSIFVFWMKQGVRVFRIDNPHTKPFAMWQWCIEEVKRVDPNVVLLSEAFTRSATMYRLTKVGFTQSYTFFAWRNTKRALTEYFTEITAPPISDFYRPNAWPNTPDILTPILQTGARPAFVARLVLAATLSASYGIYGPAYELMEHEPLEPGSEDYLNSDKYEIRHWDIDREDSLKTVITALNKARRENPALQSNKRLSFHDVNNERIIAYSKTSANGENIVLCVVNLDWVRPRRGTMVLPLKSWGIPADARYEVRDLLADRTYHWKGTRQRLRLDPLANPAHVFQIALPTQRRARR
jgi:starch synthase (maltosyl-transferring)